MTPDQIEQVRDHLRLRIRETVEWAEKGFPGDAFASFRAIIQGHLCTICPFQFLDLNEPAAERKQSNGSRFKLTWEESPDFRAFVDVLLAPDVKTNERLGKGPWVKVKAVDLREGSKVSPKKDVIAPWVVLDDCNPGQAIDEFYRMWLTRALANEKKDKILDFVYSSADIE